MLDRIMGVLTLKAPVYRQIADDKNDTMNAAIVLVVSTLISGFFGGLVSLDVQSGASSISIVGAVFAAIFGVIFALIGWVVTAWVLQFVAKQLGGKTDTGEMLRVTGYVGAFSLIGVLNVLTIAGAALSCVVGLVSIVVAVLRLIGYLIGVREAAEFSTTNAIITAVIAAIVNFIIVVVIGGAIALSVVAVLGIAGAATGG
jgi:hypothetical protein